jgi:3'(2'), 5'-bisphosphate nucleotidase
VIAEERSEEFMLLLDDTMRMLVQRFVTDALGGYVFEEQICAWLDYGKQKQAERTWVIDPIDGTKGFLGNRHYCVAIGLLIDQEPVLGVLASPGFYSDDPNFSGDPGALTYAARGIGAFTESLYGGEREPIHVSKLRDPRRATFLTSYESAHTDMSLMDQVQVALGRDESSPQHLLDSQDKHAMIASGIGDIFLRVVPDMTYFEKLWDHTAGYVIVTEAGGRVTDIYGQPLDFSAGTRFVNNRGVLMTNGLLHDDVLAAIAAASDL